MPEAAQNQHSAFPMNTAAPLFFLWGIQFGAAKLDTPILRVAVRESMWTAKTDLYRTATYLAVCMVMIYG